MLLAAISHAQTVAPNPGGTIVVTNSTTSTISYAGAPVTQRVDNYSTTLLAAFNGGQVFSQTFPAAFTAPSVQAAIVQADGILSGDGATFGSPSLTSNTVVLQTSVATPSPTYTCATAAQYATGSITFT
jgi:hypothetical protein